MKQGSTPTVQAGHKREPNPHAVDVCATYQIGTSVSYRKEELYKGKGYKAPMSNDECHHCGSQGKH